MTLYEMIEECKEEYGKGTTKIDKRYNENHFVFEKKLCGIGNLHIFKNVADAPFCAIYIDDYEDFSIPYNSIADVNEMVKSWSSPEHQEVIKNTILRKDN